MNKDKQHQEQLESLKIYFQQIKRSFIKMKALVDPQSNNQAKEIKQQVFPMLNTLQNYFFEVLKRNYEIKAKLDYHKKWAIKWQKRQKEQMQQIEKLQKQLKNVHLLKQYYRQKCEGLFGMEKKKKAPKMEQISGISQHSSVKNKFEQSFQSLLVQIPSYDSQGQQHNQTGNLKTQESQLQIKQKSESYNSQEDNSIKQCLINMNLHGNQQQK